MKNTTFPFSVVVTKEHHMKARKVLKFTDWSR